MDFLIWSEMFSSWDIWQNPQFSKFVMSHKNIAINWKLHFWLFLLIGVIKMKVGEILVHLMRNISFMFWAGWKFEYCPWLADQVSWHKELWLRIHIEKCTVTRVLILISWRHKFGSRDGSEDKQTNKKNPWISQELNISMKDISMK